MKDVAKETTALYYRALIKRLQGNIERQRAALEAVEAAYQAAHGILEGLEEAARKGSVK